MKQYLHYPTLIIALLGSPDLWAQPSTREERLLGVDTLWNLAVVALVVYGTTTIIRTLSDNRVKRLLIEKGLPAEQIKYVFGHDPRMSLLSSLRYGFLSLGIGAGLVLNYSSWPFGIITFGLIGVGAAFGFLLYALVAGMLLKQDRSTSDRPTPSSGS